MAPFVSASYRADEAVIYSAVCTDKGPPSACSSITAPAVANNNKESFRNLAGPDNIVALAFL